MDDQRLTEASEWFVRLREATATNDVIGAWLQWCNDNAENARAYREIQEIWSLARDAGVNEWPSPGEVRSDPYRGETPIRDWKRMQTESTPHPAPAAMLPRRWPSRALAAAACIVLAIGAWSFVHDRGTQSAPRVYATERADKRQVRLTDGSTVALGGASTIRVAYGDDRRSVELQAGEAHFKVKPDRARPFVVHTKDINVTAVGTAFTVRADDVRTVVSVTEGVVQIAAADGSPRQLDEPLRAQAGEQVIYDAQLRAASKQPTDESRALGWQDGALSYFDEPLRSVIARINRNSTRELVLTDPALGELRFTGTVLENQIPEWALGLERVFPVRVVARKDGRIELEPR